MAIVDACKSGAGFLQKGGVAAEPFTIKLTDTLVASELVLASLVKPSASLILPEGADGSLVTLYGLRLYKGGQSLGARVVLAEGMRKSIRWEELAVLTSSMVVAAKGGAPSVSGQQLEAPRLEENKKVLSVLLGTTRGVADEAQIIESSIQARFGFRWGWDLGPLWLGLGAEVGPAFLW